MFMYKVLEKVGYGPKVEFLLVKNFANLDGEIDGVMIASQDSGFSKDPSKNKKFQTFAELNIDPNEDFDVEKETRKDLIVIDILSRVFGLSDVMTNFGNFGKVIISQDEEILKEKWKVLDFSVPALRKIRKKLHDSKDRYLYQVLYKEPIVDSFINGNGSHSYSNNEVVVKILTDEQTIDLWSDAVKILEEGKNSKKSLESAIEDAESEIINYLEKNGNELHIYEKDEPSKLKVLTVKRINDLKVYCECV